MTTLCFIGCHNQSELGLRARDQSCLLDHSRLYILYIHHGVMTVCVHGVLCLCNHGSRWWLLDSGDGPPDKLSPPSNSMRDKMSVKRMMRRECCASVVHGTHCHSIVVFENMLLSRALVQSSSLRVRGCVCVCVYMCVCIYVCVVCVHCEREGVCIDRLKLCV